MEGGDCYLTPTIFFLAHQTSHDTEKMVNLVAAQKPLLHGLMKMAGVIPHAVEIEPGTVMNIWVPRETLKKSDNKITVSPPTKPVVVLIHGFAGEGIVTWQFQVP